MEKLVNVHFLPTNTIANIRISGQSGKLEYKEMSAVYLPESGHIYFTNDEEITGWMINLDELVKDFRTMPKSTPSIAYYKHNWRKIVATTNPELWHMVNTSYTTIEPHFAPAAIPDSFIQAYIKAYNEGTPITQVLLEYNEFINQYNTKGVTNDKRVSLKLTSAGSVIWRLKEEKMYSRSELKHALIYRHEEIDGMSRPEFHRWFEQNYPQ